jgi:hypothetical protein
MGLVTRDFYPINAAAKITKVEAANPFRGRNRRGNEETVFTRSEGGFQKTLVTDFNSFREFSTESVTYHAHLDSFKLKDTKFRFDCDRVDNYLFLVTCVCLSSARTYRLAHQTKL